MTLEEMTRLIVSFLGGGLVSGLLNWIRTARIERRNRRAEFVRSQLRELYGPLQFFAACNQQLLDLGQKLDEAHKKEYIDQKWSTEYGTQENVRERSTQTIEIANQYVKQTTKNNERILGILTDHYHLIEPEDIEVCSQFIVHQTRLRTEFDKAGHLLTPYEVYQHLGGISFMPPQFAEAIARRFREKKRELEKLLG